MTSQITKINWDQISDIQANTIFGEGYTLYAVWPSPIDWDTCFEEAGFHDFADSDREWHQDFEHLLYEVVNFLSAYGPPTIIQDNRPVYDKTFSRFIRKFVKGTDEGSSLHTLITKIKRSTSDDQFGPLSLSFGALREVMIKVSEGHPILWIGLKGGIFPDMTALLTTLSKNRALERFPLNWRILLPVGSRLSH